MEFMSLTEKDFENLEMLEKITSVIAKLYDELCILSINNKLDTKEYQDKLDKLQISLEAEKIQYDSMNLNYFRIICFLEYINTQIKKDTKESIIDQNYDNKINYRILKNLLQILHGDSKLYRQFAQDAIEIGAYDIDKIEEETSLQMALERDINYLFVSNLEKLINNDEYLEYKKQLIMTKFLWAFIESDITIIENCNLLTQISMFDSVSESYSMPDFEKEDFINDTQEHVLLENIKKLLKKEDKKNTRKKDLIKLLLRQTYINAYLEIFNIKKLIEIQEKTEKIISDNNLMSTNSEASSLVIDSIKGTISDKALKLIKV